MHLTFKKSKLGGCGISIYLNRHELYIKDKAKLLLKPMSSNASDIYFVIKCLPVAKLKTSC